ncbi:hypothetical protein CFC35_41785 [Streptomyces sp. FBKL.4005]|uniref:hypothetical protein n=1 Tax=Streptomyces sp. FBKL.4005 TaxID=2015515 RepID=UPI000B967222|nr:hypothetical protein [Streptomyces sp. FBKL.4005]OYP10050.1 hypothetical protein CFC35_41785 [Streptomyces sp. FBKL.4005]
MKKPNRLMTFLLSLVGQSWAYDTVDEVQEVIGKNAFDNYERRVTTHRKGAAGITDSLGFQPGLVDLHDELNDTWHYLMALQQRARDLGHLDLADSMMRAAENTVDVMTAVDQAAEQTVPAPEVPLSR